MLVSESLAAAGTLMIWVTCADTRAKMTELLPPRALSVSMFLLQLGPVTPPQEVIRIMYVEI